MVSITFSIPEETRKTMKEFPEINWTHIVRSSIEEKARKLELKKELLKKLKGEESFIDWSVETVRNGRNKK
ncbi:MAG: hypothetical protein KKC19_01995 [Nanoarchaeota archaeon]|nr:hypothetical protein [Nanoarchaeota archaeon]